MYRLGWPCAEILAEIGVPILIKVEINHDPEAETIDELEKEVPELLVLDRPMLPTKTETCISFFQPPIAV
jgi:hypothetical protein